MLSKCANPECSAVLRYLGQGRIFYLAPTPDVKISIGINCALWHERFWLCDRCAKHMTVVWSGNEAAVAPLPAKRPEAPPPARKAMLDYPQTRSRAASHGRGNRGEARR